MLVFIVKHKNVKMWASSNNHPVDITNDIQKAFRFGTTALAEKCRQRMPIPTVWKIIQVSLQNGAVITEA